MKKLWIAAMGALALVAGCRTDPPAASVRGAGSVAFAPDGVKLLVVDGDNDELLVVDPAAEAVSGRVKVGKGPTRVVVGADGRAFVANRFDRSVSVVDAAAQKELSRITVGAEPVSLGFSADGTKLVVANHTSRSLSIVDVAAGREVSQVALPADPTGLRVVGTKAYVGYGRASELSVVDLEQRAVVQGPSLSLALTLDQTGGDKRIPGQAVDPVFDEASGHLFVPHVQSKETPVATTEPGAYAGGAGTVPVVANAVVTVDATSDTVMPAPLANTSKSCPECDIAVSAGLVGSPSVSADGVPSALAAVSGPSSGPQAAVLDPSGRWMFVANLHSNNVQVVAVAPGAAQVNAVRVGRGPTGIAISADGKQAFVYNSFDHTVSVLEGREGEIVATREFPVGKSPLTPEQDLGRKLFFAADDARMTNAQAGGIACASCHPGGREDGRTWQFTEGPRNTPSLAGRSLGTTAPYHWDGLLTDMHAFRVVVEARMGGSGTQFGSGTESALSVADFNAMLAYLDAQPRPDNPKRGTETSEPVLRGKALFEGKAACASCHSGKDFTDDAFYDVGTIGRTATGEREHFDRGVNTPPLHNLFDSAPYLHDGSIRTLRERVTINPGDRHGVTSTLTPAEVDDLVAYLETL
jgi:YVTN family beta-propeller protein